jgi:hypothetical protein
MEEGDFHVQGWLSQTTGLDKMVFHAEIHDELSVTRIPWHLVRKDIAISEEGFIAFIISRKQKVNHTITNTNFSYNSISCF